MTTKTTFTAHVVDLCYPDYLYLTNHTDIVVGVARGGQTIDEMVEQLVDELGECEDDERGAVLWGDLQTERATAAVRDAVRQWAHFQSCGVSSWRFYPVDGSGREITNPDAEVPEEQPSLWVRVVVEVEPLRIRLDNADRHDGTVMVWCDDGEDALADQNIEGSLWEYSDGTAYASVLDRPDLHKNLTAQGYDVDISEYTAPSEGTIRAH